QLGLNARISRAGKERVAPLAEVIRSAAPLDPDIGALWGRIGTEYRGLQLAVVQSVADKAALRADLEIERAGDILWAINNFSTWQLLVVERGWSAEEYERWSAEAACAELL